MGRFLKCERMKNTRNVHGKAQDYLSAVVAVRCCGVGFCLREKKKTLSF